MHLSKKSPITGKPLRQAGQSLDDKINAIINEEAMPYIFASGLVCFLALIEWWHSFAKLPPSPKTITAMAVLVIFFCIYRLVKIYKKLKSYKLGRDGERAVGEYLEGLREKGYRIFHDLIGDNFNLNHVIVSPKGIYVVETKTYSKPKKGEAKITYNGVDIVVDGCKLPHNPIRQVSAGAKWLKKILHESTGKEFDVKPVVVFPGWFVETLPTGKKADGWVLNPKALPQFIEYQQETIVKQDMMLVIFHLCRFIRTGCQKNNQMNDYK